MKQTKQVNILIAIYYAVVILSVPIILNPIYSSVSTDVLTKNTYLPGLIELLKGALEFTSYALIFSAVIYSSYITKGRKNSLLLIISSSAITLKYLINLLFDIFVNGMDSIIYTQIFSVCMYIAIEFSQIFILYCLSKKAIRETLELNKKKKNASASLGLDYTETRLLPLTSVFDRSNPIVKISLIGAILIAIPTIAGRLIYDIVVVGAPSDIVDALWIIVYYAADLFGIVISYLIIIFALNIYSEKIKEA